MPEIDMGAPLHPGMTAIIQARLPHQTAHELIVTGTRYTAEQARESKIVDEAAAEPDVLPRAIAIAASLAAKAHPAMRQLKAGMYPRTLEALALDMDSVPAVPPPLA
jgi:enoyl-CoA hydratase/carnithine racemase